MASSSLRPSNLMSTSTTFTNPLCSSSRPSGCHFQPKHPFQKFTVSPLDPFKPPQSGLSDRVSWTWNVLLAAPLMFFFLIPSNLVILSATTLFLQCDCIWTTQRLCPRHRHLHLSFDSCSYFVSCTSHLTLCTFGLKESLTLKWKQKSTLMHSLHLRVSYLVGDSESCSQADVLVDAAAPFWLTHPTYRSQTWYTHTETQVWTLLLSKSSRCTGCKAQFIVFNELNPKTFTVYIDNQWQHLGIMFVLIFNTVTIIAVRRSKCFNLMNYRIYN